MKKRVFFENAVILTATGLLLRAAGMLLRVYLAGLIGDEGMGLYQLILTFYNLFITLATAGTSVAATRLAADALARSEKSPAALCRALVLGALAVGAAAGAAQYALAAPAARFWLGDVRAVQSLRILAPSLPFMAVGATLRGFFLARRKVRSASLSQLGEQAVRIALAVLLAPAALARGGAAAACAAIVFGDTVSEVVSCLWVALAWRREQRSFAGHALPPPRLWRAWDGIVVPVTASRGLGSLLVTAENVLVPGCLTAFLGSRTQALAQFGQLKGMALPLLFFPFSFLATLSSLLLPEIAQAHAAGSRARVRALSARTVLLTVLLAVPAGALFTVFADPLGRLLYRSPEVGFYLRVLGPIMPFLYLEGMVDGILKGLGEQLATFRYSLWNSLLRIVLVLALAPRFGMKGFLFVMLGSNLFTSILSLYRLLAVTGLRFDWYRWAAAPLLCAACAFAAEHFVFAPLAARLIGPALPAAALPLLGAAVLLGVYLLFLWLLGLASPRRLAQLCGRGGPAAAAQ